MRWWVLRSGLWTGRVTARRFHHFATRYSLKNRVSRSNSSLTAKTLQPGTPQPFPMMVSSSERVDSGKIGRMAVSQSMRGQGIGRDLLDALVAEAKQLKFEEVSLGAQLAAVSFYERAGFMAYGDVFLDAGIDHRMMKLVLG